MSKCIYCGTKIEKGRLRCDVCDKAWQEGFRDGGNALKDELRAMKNDFKRLLEKE